MTPSPSRLKPVRHVRLAVVTAILLLALLQRLSAAFNLEIDADEGVYAWAASYYAGLMARGEWSGIPDYTYNIEHPVFVKLLYAVGLRAAGHTGIPDQPEAPPPRGFLEWHKGPAALGIYKVNRLISVLFGTLQVLVLTLANPLSGGLLAIHTMTIKYTSEMYLEAVPAFAVTLSILAYERGRRRGSNHTGGWFWLSAGLLGVAVASKYVYLVPGLAMAPFIIWQQRRTLWNALLYALLALAVFFALNPILWPDPVGRLRESVLYHSGYAASAEVARYGHPWWQPLNWMSGAAVWHPDVFWFPFDFFIFLLSLAGLPFLFRQNRLYFAWFVVGWAFLFLWPTKWPQYTLIVTPAISLSVGALWQAIARRYNLHLDRKTWERIKFYLPDRTFWIRPPRSFLIAVVVLVVLFSVGYVVARIIRIRQLHGWTTYTASEGQLTDDRITALALDQAERVWIGTRRGLTVYQGDRPTFYYAGSQGLIDDRVTALALDRDGHMWVGTEAGVNVYKEGTWITYTAQEMGLREPRVRALAVDGAGRVWVGTLTGAAVWDGATWRNFSPAEAGLTSEAVLALTVDSTGRVWMGTDKGVAVLDLSGKEPDWITYTTSSGLTTNGIRALALHPSGEVWIGTGGGGLCKARYDLSWGDRFVCHSIANSALPWNTVTALMVDGRGVVWVATEMPTQIGGAVAVLEIRDGLRWRTYTPHNSGLVSGAVTAILQDREGRYWFGTQFKGVSVYEG